jgi:hypothetical protein
MADQMAEQNAASAFVERKVEADGFTIRYLEGGPQSGGADPVVCIHGAGACASRRCTRSWPGPGA